jgi:GT2 family glycosyltransferase
MKLSVSIVATNEREQLKKCLATLLEDLAEIKDKEIFVVDNASNDGISEMIPKDHPEVRVIRNNEKMSFCDNHNMVINKSTGDMVYIMNADLFVKKGSTKILIGVLEKDPRIGAVMGKLLSGWGPEKDQKIDSTGIVIFKNRETIDRGQGELDQGQYEVEGEIFSPSGAAMLCRREMLNDIELFGEYFDHTFFAYKEELDLCWRARLKGWKMWYTPTAIAYHLRGWGKQQKRTAIPLFIRRHSYKNRYLMILKDDHLVNVFLHFPFILIREILALGFLVIREPSLFPAWGKIFLLLPLTLRKRWIIMRGAKVKAKDIRKWFK